MDPEPSLPPSCPACHARVAASDTSCAACGTLLSGEASVTAADPRLMAAAMGAGSDHFAAAPNTRASRHGAPPGAPQPGRPPLDQLQPGEAFGRYHIIKLLGVGGMGAVYQAWDDELAVAVAIKTIRPGVGTDPTTATNAERRFKRELVLARQVTHPNVVRIHDLGDINGIKYITMPFVNGDTLAVVLANEGRVPLARALAIFRQLVSGMRAAHDKGVVHRDLKPANIMIEDDVAFIMDFGIARQVDAATMMTMVGVVVGTVEYMAPEQARGFAVDQRADIYALGLILRDMILGRSGRPHTDNPVSDLMQRLTAPPPSVRSVAPDVPEPIDQLITRCLQIDPDARYENTAALEAALAELDDTGNLRDTAGTPAVAVAAGRTPLVRWLIRAALTLAVAGAAGGAWIAARRTAAPALAVAHAPVSVVIADFQNTAGDPTFDQTLEPVLKLALEGAEFISAYDRLGIARSLGVRPPDVLDERAANEIAVKQGLGVVLAGAVGRQGSQYSVTVKATRAVTGDVIATATETAAGKDQVLAVTTKLAASIREALGDDTSDSAKRFAMETLSATSLDVVREYAGAMDALSRSKFEEARRGFARAVQRDPSFGLAHAGLAIASRNLDNQQDAVKYVEEAVRHLDGMTERERYRTRGLYYYLTSDYQACVKEYGDLIARFSGDAAARNNLALCMTYLRDMPGAVAEMRHVVKILPNRALYRVNLALYAAYGGDYASAEQEVRAMKEPGVFGQLALAFARIAQGQLPQAAETYRSIEKIDALGASYAASGLGDLAVYEGRFADAARIYADGAAADLSGRDTDRAANKLVALARTRALLDEATGAIAAAEQALAQSQAVKIRFLAARVFVDAGAPEKAKAAGSALASELPAEPRAYAKIIGGLAAMNDGDPRRAIELLNEANRQFDTWIGHFDLGRAYLDAEAFTQADSEFDRCLKRRGEALALFLDEEPTYGMFPPAYYYQGRAREGLKNTRFAESYGAYLDIRGKSVEDSRVSELRAKMK